MAAWIQGTVIENQHWTERLFSLQVQADITAFSAGQFVTLALDIDGERIARPYSFVNAPAEQPLQFYATSVAKGQLSSQLQKLAAGDRVWIKAKAKGFFVLNEVPVADNLWLLCSGTGIGPFLSILKTMQPWKSYRQIVLVHAVSKAEDLNYRRDIDAIQQQHGRQLTVVYFVSREQIKNTLTGRIPEAISQGLLEQRVNIKLSSGRSQVMLCGNPDMVKDSLCVLKNRGFKQNLRRKPGQITIENYW